MVNPTYFINCERWGGSLPRGTHGLLCGSLPKLVCAVRFGEWVGWCSSSIWPKSEAIGPTLDNVSGECAKLERAVELVNNLIGIASLTSSATTESVGLYTENRKSAMKEMTQMLMWKPKCGKNHGSPQTAEYTMGEEYNYEDTQRQRPLVLFFATRDGYS